jgi:hypothetical protein
VAGFNISDVVPSGFPTMQLVCYITGSIIPLKAQWKLYVAPTVTFSNSSICIYLFRMVLRVNSDYFLKQNWLTDLRD